MGLTTSGPRQSTAWNGMHRGRDCLRAHREGSCHRPTRRVARTFEWTIRHRMSGNFFPGLGVKWNGAPASVTPRNPDLPCLWDYFLGLRKRPSSRQCANGLGLFGHLRARPLIHLLRRAALRTTCVACSDVSASNFSEKRRNTCHRPSKRASGRTRSKTRTKLKEECNQRQV